jgi:hypothetical protein
MRRGGNSKTSMKSIQARQREAQVLERLQKGETFEKIAEALGYSDASGAWRAATRALNRIPVGAAEELRRLDTLRVEEMLLALRPAIQRGDARSIEVALKVLAHKAKLNGYAAPSKVEVTGRDGRPVMEDDEKFQIMASRLDDSDQLALLALMNKARGGPPRSEPPSEPTTNGHASM